MKAADMAFFSYWKEMPSFPKYPAFPRLTISTATGNGTWKRRRRDHPNPLGPSYTGTASSWSCWRKLVRHCAGGQMVSMIVRLLLFNIEVMGVSNSSLIRDTGLFPKQEKAQRLGLRDVLLSCSQYFED
jgi:hypothetical protein